MQWHASLPDDVWKEFSTKNGVNRFIDSAGQPCYEIEIEGMDENVFLKEKESWSNQTLVLPPKYQTNMEVASWFFISYPSGPSQINDFFQLIAGQDRCFLWI